MLDSRRVRSNAVTCVRFTHLALSLSLSPLSHTPHLREVYRSRLRTHARLTHADLSHYERCVKAAYDSHGTRLVTNYEFGLALNGELQAT